MSRSSMSGSSTFGRVLGNLQQSHRRRKPRRRAQPVIAEGLENRVMLSGGVTLSLMNSPIENHVSANVHVHISLAPHSGTFTGISGFQINWGAGGGWTTLGSVTTDFTEHNDYLEKNDYFVSAKGLATWVSGMTTLTQHLAGSADINVADGTLSAGTTTLT